ERGGGRRARAAAEGAGGVYRLADGLAGPELQREIHAAERARVGGLLVVGRPRVAAVGVLVEEHLVPLLQHARGHLARVYGGDAIVAGGRDEEHGRVAPVRLDVLIGRVLHDPGAVGGPLGVAVFGGPGRTGSDVRIADHVDQRHLADHGAEELRPLYEIGRAHV